MGELPLALFSRRSFLQLSGMTILHACSLDGKRSPEERGKLRLFDQGQWYATVSYDPQASAQVQTATTVLAQYCQRSTGVAINVTTQPVDGRARIHVTTNKKSRVQTGQFDAREADGFVIDFPNTQTVRIMGATDWGTEFGIYEFLERYLGVRWLLPGPAGEYVPQVHVLELHPEPVYQSPVFSSRQLSGLRGEAQGTWARRQRQHGRIEFHHNLSKLFPPNQYTQTHPHFFPILKGKRFLPASNMTLSWQPCFSAPGLVEEAVKNICAYFARSPSATSYSLGVNDGLGYCECALCQQVNKGQKNFVGLNDASVAYFSWANAVAEGVLQHYPDKWFGCLAYRAIAQAPTTCTVHPRIVPFLTYDRLKWVDPTIATEGQRLTEAWQKAASQIGWYDYLYGTPYCIPRVYFHTMAEYYRYGAQHDVSAMYAEAYPNWGEGPKLYIALKLQWDPTLDVDVLLREWCEKTVGVAAAPALLAYYLLWERFWTQTVVSSSWFTGQKNEYLPFGRPDYLDLITDEVFQSRALLDAVIAKTQTAEQRARAMLLGRAFEYYEASALSYVGRKSSGTGVAERAVTSVRAKGDVKESAHAIAAKRSALVAEFQHDPILQHPLSFERFNSLRW